MRGWDVVRNNENKKLGECGLKRFGVDLEVRRSGIEKCETERGRRSHNAGLRTVTVMRAEMSKRINTSL